MGRAVFPPHYLTCGQTMVEIMKIMGTSFRRSHSGTAARSALGPVAGHCQPTPHSETSGHWWASVGQSLLGSLLLSPRSWYTQGFTCALQESVSPVLCKIWQLYGGVNGDLPQEGLCHTQVCVPRASVPEAVHCWPVPPQEILKQFWLSLCGIFSPRSHKHFILYWGISN